MQAEHLTSEEYFITHKPYYEAVGTELAIFEAAYKNQLPVLLTGARASGIYPAVGRHRRGQPCRDGLSGGEPRPQGARLHG